MEHFNWCAINVISYTNNSLSAPQQRPVETVGRFKCNLTVLSEAEKHVEMLDMLN